LIDHSVAIVAMEKSLPLFTSFSVLAVNAFAVVRTKDICLETLTVLLEAP